MKKNVIIILSFMLFFTASPVFAQLQTDSNTINTRVGNPPVLNDVAKIGMDIKSAYDTCNNGDTHDTNGTLGSCLRTQLTSLSYLNAYLDAFETRRKSSMTNHPDGTYCTECVGYIGLILTLLSGSTNTLNVNAASDVTSFSSINAGGVVFQKISDSEPLLPGDIGAHGGEAGHILMVNQVLGNVKFSALESNGNFDCHITSGREINRDGYVFFRKM
jgi:hypothetical protein